MNSLRPWEIRMKVQPRHATLVLSCCTRKTPWRSRLRISILDRLVGHLHRFEGQFHRAAAAGRD